MNHKTNGIYCNSCGKEIKKVDDRNMPDYLKVDKTWGYFSDKDLMRHSFVICESCYDKWVKTFIIPVEEDEQMDVFGDLHDSLIFKYERKNGIE